MTTARPQFSLLGPLSVSCDGAPIALGGQKRRALLAALLLEANHVVSRDRLIDGLWGEDPPDTARNTIQVYISQLRKLLPEGALETAPPGYRLVVDPETVDLFEFTRLSEEGRTALGDRIDADLGLGRHGQLVAELEGLVAEHPLRERLRGQLMLALYRAGRQADALRAYQDARKMLVDDLGLEPSVPLQRLERAILNHDPALELPAGIPRPDVVPPA